MRRKFRLEAVIIDGYYFLDSPGLLWHSGSFWFIGTELKTVYNNGSQAVDIFGSKRGVKKLRKQARSCKITIYKESLPF